VCNKPRRCSVYFYDCRHARRTGRENVRLSICIFRTFSVSYHLTKRSFMCVSCPHALYLSIEVLVENRIFIIANSLAVSNDFQLQPRYCYCSPDISQGISGMLVWSITMNSEFVLTRAFGEPCILQISQCRSAGRFIR